MLLPSNPTAWRLMHQRRTVTPLESWCSTRSPPDHRRPTTRHHHHHCRWQPGLWRWCSQPAGPSKRPRPPLNVPNVVPARPPQKQWETATPDVCTNGAAVTTGTTFLVENAQSVHRRRRSLHQDQASRSTWRSTTGGSWLSTEDPTLHIGSLSKS